MFNMNYNRKGCLNNSTAKCECFSICFFKLCKFIWQTIPGWPKEIAMKTELCEELFICVLVWFLQQTITQSLSYGSCLYTQSWSFHNDPTQMRLFCTFYYNFKAQLCHSFHKMYPCLLTIISIFLPSYLQNSITFSQVSGSSYSCPKKDIPLHLLK